MLFPLFAFALYGWFEARRIIIRQYNIYFEELPPAFDGYSILHLSDLHFTKPGRLAEEIRNYLEVIPVDLALFTGDYRYKKYTAIPGVMDCMKIILPALHVRDGAFTCLGNQDTPVMIPELESFGLRVLRNSSVRIDRDSDSIYILGVDERNPFKEISNDPDESLKGVPENSFRILLAHSPDYIRWASKNHIHIVLAGDTHGGQIRLPYLSPPRVKSMLSRKYCRGWIHEDGVKMFINSGLASVGLPLRTFCPPEIVQIRLHKGNL